MYLQRKVVPFSNSDDLERVDESIITLLENEQVIESTADIIDPQTLQAPTTEKLLQAFARLKNKGV
jgi:hypothetical protein